MPATTRLHAIKVAIADGLALRAGLAGVQITSGYIGDEKSAVESIQLSGDDSIESDWAQVGKFARDERITLVGIITVDKPGAGETVVRACRERAVELMAEVEGFFVGTGGDPSVGGTVKQCKVRPTQLYEGFSPEGRWALLRFEIEAWTRLQAS